MRSEKSRSIETETVLLVWLELTFFENSSAINRFRRQESQSKFPAHLSVTTGVDMMVKGDGQGNSSSVCQSGVCADCEHSYNHRPNNQGRANLLDTEVLEKSLQTNSNRNWRFGFSLSAVRKKIKKHTPEYFLCVSRHNEASKTTTSETSRFGSKEVVSFVFGVSKTPDYNASCQ